LGWFVSGERGRPRGVLRNEKGFTKKGKGWGRRNTRGQPNRGGRDKKRAGLGKKGQNTGGGKWKRVLTMGLGRKAAGLVTKKKTVLQFKGFELSNQKE